MKTLKCNKCGYIWDYKGNASTYASCSKCLTKVKIHENLVDNNNNNSLQNFINTTETKTTPVETTQTVEKIEAPVNSKKLNMDSYIPTHNGYISRRMLGTTDVNLVKKMYLNKDYLLIIGDTGCGKTHLIRHLAYELKKPYMRVNMNGAVTPDQLIGQWIPNPNAKTDADPKFVWQDGVLTTFMREGGIFVCDEINMAEADILSMFHSVTDDERRLVLMEKDGEVINAHPDFWFVSTMNEDYEGTKPLNPALKDRFRIIHMDYNKAVEKKLKVPDTMLSIANKLRKSQYINTPVSTRDLIQFTGDIEKYGDRIAQELFVAKFDRDERNAVTEIIELVNSGNDSDSDDSNDYDSEDEE